MALAGDHLGDHDILIIVLEGRGCLGILWGKGLAEIEVTVTQLSATDIGIYLQVQRGSRWTGRGRNTGTQVGSRKVKGGARTLTLQWPHHGA